MSDPGKLLRQHPVQVGRDQVRQEQEQSSKLGVEDSRCQIKWADIRHIAHDGAELVGSLLVTASRQFGEALFLEDRGDRRRAERLAVAGEGASDIVDGEVLLPERDDLLAQPFLLAGGPSLARAGGRIRGGVDGGTDGRERESFLGCSRSGRPPEPRGAPRRSRPVRLRTGDEWSWRARGTGEPKLVDL